MDDAEFIADRVASLERSVRYFSTDDKDERERWVVKTLLRNMNIRHSAENVLLQQPDPPDVIALGGNFEVKEILTSGRKRHQEYKDELERARTITDPHDFITSDTPVDFSVSDIFECCLADIKRLRNKYSPSVRAALDLVFYVNLEHVYQVHEEPFPNVSALEAYGWRSVSFVKGQIACCFYATVEAPGWLQEKVGGVQHKV